MTPQEIKELRAKLSISQEGLARLIGVTVLTVNRWERGKTIPSPLSIQRIKAIYSEDK